MFLFLRRLRSPNVPASPIPSKPNAEASCSPVEGRMPSPDLPIGAPERPDVPPEVGVPVPTVEDSDMA